MDLNKWWIHTQAEVNSILPQRKTMEFAPFAAQT